MYFLTRAFKQSWIPQLVCLLLCIYGVEVYQFSVITTSVTANWGSNYYCVIAILLGLVIFAGSGGVRRVAAFQVKVYLFFVIVYVSMGTWVLVNNLGVIPTILKEVFISAFTGHAALGGFAGAHHSHNVSWNTARLLYRRHWYWICSVIHSESSAQIPEKQAALAIFDIFLDTFIVCTTSLFLILTTGIWHEPIEAGMLVQTV